MHFEYTMGDARLCLTTDQATPSRSAAAALEGPMTNSPASPTAKPSVTSPCVGFFLAAHPALAAPPAVFPRAVSSGDIVGYIRSGLTLRAVQVSAACRLLRPLVLDGAGVGYGDRLFETAV